MKIESNEEEKLEMNENNKKARDENDEGSMFNIFLIDV